MAGTVYGIHQAFHSLDGYAQATSSVVPGILAALVATLIGMLLIVPLAAVWCSVEVPDDDDGAA